MGLYRNLKIAQDRLSWAMIAKIWMSHLENGPDVHGNALTPTLANRIFLFS